MHPPAVLTLAPLGVVLGGSDTGLQLADLGVMGAVFAQERTLAAGKLRELVLPALHLVLQVGQGLAARLFCRPASATTPPAVVMVAAESAHPHPQPADFLLGMGDRGEGPFGATGLTLGVEPRRRHVRQTSG